MGRSGGGGRGERRKIPRDEDEMVTLRDGRRVSEALLRAAEDDAGWGKVIYPGGLEISLPNSGRTLTVESIGPWREEDEAGEGDSD